MSQTARSELALPVIAGNWKMNHGPGATDRFFDDFLSTGQGPFCRTLIFFPPAISLETAAGRLRGRTDLALGVQNIHWEASGAFTGEISAPMAEEVGARYVLIGHSERRHVFGETDEDARRKLAAVLASELRPVLCLGETLAEREAGRLEEVIGRQLTSATVDLDADRIAPILIAYEPVWAIGTGRNATPGDASAAHAVLRQILAGRFGEVVATGIPILYGGSVKPDNASELLSAEGVDGLLVGGASLDPKSFSQIAIA